MNVGDDTELLFCAFDPPNDLSLRFGSQLLDFRGTYIG